MLPLADRLSSDQLNTAPDVLYPNENKSHRRAKISLSPRDHRHSREVTRLRAQLRASDSSELMKALSIVKKLVEPGGREEALQGSRLVKFRLTTLS